MTNIFEVQRRLMQAVLSGDATTVTPIVRAGLAAPSERVAVYRQHYLASLTEALASVYPVTRSLVGESFFSVLAEQNIARHPPLDPRLSRYGAELAAVIDGSLACASLPYLSGVARLEWALSQASLAELPTPLSAPETQEKIAGALGRTRLRLLPSLGVLSSDFPVDEIWRAHEGGALDKTMHLEARPTWLQVAADEGGPYFRKVTKGEYTLKRKLLDGCLLEEALNLVMGEDSTLDPIPLLTRFFEEGCIVGVNSDDLAPGVAQRSL